MTLLEKYLWYLSLTEREWNTPTENPDSFDRENFKNLLAHLGGLHIFRKMRHSLQPSMFNIYIKNCLGDYMGRPNSMNTQTIRNVGFDQFVKKLDDLKQKMDYASKMKTKKPDNFFNYSSSPFEVNEPGDATTIGDDGVEGADGGSDSGGNQ